ncbi:apovitellenin-1-like [Pyxicephalus adspersus]|uniref:apovitellenin-1-like n=1 Tax=Pyxicephalus adspersus TaxID=30357 RepID=UPI003B5AF526
MRVTITTTVILLLLLNGSITGADGKAVSKRHVRRDWLIIADSISFYIYEAVNKVSPETGNLLLKLFESDPVQKTRSFLIEKTSCMNLRVQEFYEKVTEFFNEKKWFT